MNKGKVDVLLGLQWGDEGKGKVVDVLTPQYDVVARFQGGPNAGHTLEFEGQKYVLRSIPSGIFQGGKVNIIGNGVVLAPDLFMDEAKALEASGHNLRDRLHISKKAHLIMPTHRVLDAAYEAAKGKSRVGTTGKGIGPTYTDKISRNGLRVGDIFEDFADKVAEECASSDPAALCVVISVVRPDKRRTPAKKLLKVGKLVPVASMSDPEDMVFAVERAARERGVSIDEDAARLLVGKVNGHARMTFSELEKLACSVGPGGTIDEKTVMRLVPVFGAGDFFEPAEYFFAGDLAGTLESLRRFFFNNASARPLLAALQNRNRLLIQLRALVDAGDAALSSRGGISKSAIEAAEARYGHLFGGNDEKSSLNLFSQNAWYVGEKVAGATLRDKSVTLKRLIDRQLEFVRAFEALIARPGEDEAVMRELAVRCLSC